MAQITVAIHAKTHKLLRAASVSALFAVLFACGGGGSGNQSSVPVTGAANEQPSHTTSTVSSANANSLARKTVFSNNDIRHFLARTHFGIETGKTAEIQSKGLEVYIDEMMSFPQADMQPFETTAGLLLLDDNDPAGLEGKFPSESDIADWNIHLLMNNPNAFQEVLGMFWQDHFGVDARALDNDEHHLMISYINLLRQNGAGSFRNLLLDVSRHGAMLVFLDGADNSKFAPNENYAREFWELFALGVDNGYTEDDIVEASRAFTGWRRQFNANTGLTRVFFDPESKAVGSKQPINNSISHDLSKDDYGTMVDLTMDHRGIDNSDLVADFIALKLLTYFAQENPSPTLVTALANTLRQNNMQVGATLKELFLSEAFYSDTSRQGLVRDFYDQVVGLVRTTGLTESAHVYRSYLTNMNSLPSRPPSVEGWPEGDDKINAQSSGIELPNFVSKLISNRNDQLEDGYDIAVALQPIGVTGPDQVVDHISQLLGVTLADDERESIISYMNTHVNNEGEETPLTYTPQNTDHQDRKLRNMLWILSQHPTFHTK